MRRLLRLPVTWVVLSVAVAGLVVGLALFEPWRAFTSSRLDEPAPMARARPTTETMAAEPTVAAEPVVAEPVVLSEGRFVSQEHETSGVAKLLDLGEGNRVLRLESFTTSDGPDVHVWLSDAAAGGEWASYDDGRHVALGEIKATDGNHNYAIPPGVDLAGLNSVVIWCDRFNVAFGSAPLAL